MIRPVTKQIQEVIDKLKEKDSSQVKLISDGYHTFGELYNHRMALTLALLRAHPTKSWRSKQHGVDDSPMFDGSFIVGINTPMGQVSYHYNLEHWDKFDGIRTLEHAPNWDGHTPNDCIERIMSL